MAKLINGEKRGRPGRWLLDFYDGSGKRRVLTFPSKDEANAALAKVLTETRQQDAAPADFNLTTGDYATRWLDTLSVSVKPRSLDSYSQNWRLHLEPRFGKLKLRALRRSGIQAHLVGLLKDGMSRGTVKLIHSVLRAMCNAAVADGLLSSNPADKIGRTLKLAQSKAAVQEEIKALDREQLARLLAAAKGDDYPLLLLLARTGLRVSEAIGLEWTDLDGERRQLTVARAISRGATSTPKSGRSRTVDVSAQLAETLRHLLVTRKAQTLKKGWDHVPRLMFCTPAGEALTEDRIRGAMSRALTTAKLPGHFTPHCLRHTFASLLLQVGESPAYVQRQLGHASIQLTVDTYGKWLPMGNVAAVDRLDDQLVTATGSKVAISGGSDLQVSDLPALTEPHNSSTSSPTHFSEPHAATLSHPQPRVNPVEPPCLASPVLCPGGWLR